MCGIAGIFDLADQRPVDRSILERMAAALVHRGPDEAGFHFEPGLGLGSRRLSILGIADGQQPVFNEDHSVVAAYNGELFDFDEKRAWLRSRGHTIRSHCDSELIVHLWEEFGSDMFVKLRGQFAFALFDRNQQTLVLCRDRVGICPLYWTRHGHWLLFASEIKAILASGMVQPNPDVHGLDQVLSFFCMPGRRTAFRGIQSVLPGEYLRATRNRNHESHIFERTYWDLDFPDRGHERNPSDSTQLLDEFETTLDNAVKMRLRADVPVAAYLSGGVDSSAIVAKSRRHLNGRFCTFTARIGDRRLDESGASEQFAIAQCCDHQTVTCNRQALLRAYPQVTVAADSPVVDVNAGSLLELSKAVHDRGYKVVLTGEGADEALAGYVWFKVHKLFQVAGWRQFRPLNWIMDRFYHFEYSRAPRGEYRRINEVLGGLHAQTLVYHGTSTARWWLLRDDVRKEIQSESAFDQLKLDPARIRRWHPLNQSLYLGYKTQLPGLLLNHRGDRVAMANSVEARYPFLDDDLIALCAAIHPRWKLRGMYGDKYLLRQTAQRFLPKTLAQKPKSMFRAPFSKTLLADQGGLADQLLSRGSLQRSPYFDSRKVHEVLRRFRRGEYLRPLRIFYEMGLCAVVATQLWHHMYFDGGLCELPSWTPVASKR
jgi:asparagine synthase (glutamine-hydrolysing)